MPFYANIICYIYSPVTSTVMTGVAMVLTRWRLQRSRRRFRHHHTPRAWSHRKNCCRQANRRPTRGTWPAKWPRRLWWPTATSTSADPWRSSDCRCVWRDVGARGRYRYVFEACESCKEYLMSVYILYCYLCIGNDVSQFWPWQNRRDQYLMYATSVDNWFDRQRAPCYPLHPPLNDTLPPTTPPPDDAGSPGGWPKTHPEVVKPVVPPKVMTLLLFVTNFVLVFYKK